jgi:hypothetical protein
MTNQELEDLRQDIDALRRAVRKANPFLRSVVSLRSYALLSIPLGILILAFCLAMHFLVRAYGSFQEVPAIWKTVSWIALALFLVGGAAMKWVIVAKRAAEIEENATFITVVKAIYGGAWANINLPIIICIVALTIFAISIGKAWYIIPANAILLGFACNSIALAVERKEYLVTGWYALLSGLAALFFIESAPYIWTAIVWPGIFLVYATSTLLYLEREEKGK